MQIQGLISVKHLRLVIKKTFAVMVMCLSAAIMMAVSQDKENTLTEVAFLALPDNKVQIDMRFLGAVTTLPRRFLLTDPARLIIDLPNVHNAMSESQSHRTVDIANISKLDVIEANNRSRIILDLKQASKFTFEQHGNSVSIVMDAPTIDAQMVDNDIQTPAAFLANKQAHKQIVQDASHNLGGPNSALSHAQSINDIDFTASKKGDGKLVIQLANANTETDVQEMGSTILVRFMNTRLPSSLQKHFDVTEFGSPVESFVATNKGKDVELKLQLRGAYQQMAYQIDNKFVVDIQSLSSDQPSVQNAQPRYKGKRISLNFQNIKVRAVLQLLAEFTGNNMVVSDSVTGNITLQLRSVPWDQALDIILKTRGLDKRDYGSVMLIAPAAEIANREKDELQMGKQVEALMPLHSELIQINYAKAKAIASLLQAKDSSLLSSRGNVRIDDRTNTLWVQDTPDKINEIRSLILKLDVPVQQVLIEARIVTVDKNFERDIGVRFGITSPSHLSGTLEGANELAKGTAPANVPIPQRLNVDLPSPIANPGTIGLALAKLGSDTLLDLELSALESEGHGDIISSPRLITANQQPATIQAGEEIPYQQATSSGATSVAFKKAVLSLKVTPQITPDHKVILDLKVNQDRPSAQLYLGVPAIITKEVETSVLVNNGQTIVLGGIYSRTRTSDVKRVPFLGNLPIVGALFRNVNNADIQEELLIFITPKILNQYDNF